MRSLLEVVLLATGWLPARGRWYAVTLAHFIELATQTVMVELFFLRCTLKLFIKKKCSKHMEPLYRYQEGGASAKVAEKNSIFASMRKSYSDYKIFWPL